MYNEIMDAITRMLSRRFPPEEGYTIYTDEVKQGLEEPCFFVYFLEPSEKEMIGLRYFRDTSICIQYRPGDIDKPSRELNRVTECLMECTRMITLKSGRKVNGTARSAHIEDDVLTFLVNYNTFGAYPGEEESPMEEIEVK